MTCLKTRIEIGAVHPPEGVRDESGYLYRPNLSGTDPIDCIPVTLEDADKVLRRNVVPGVVLRHSVVDV